MLVMLLFAACGTAPLPAGAVCEKTDTCEDGLECLPMSEFSADSCEDVGYLCTTSCDGDGDCLSLGASYKCFETCDGGHMCGATGLPGV